MAVSPTSFPRGAWGDEHRQAILWNTSDLPSITPCACGKKNAKPADSREETSFTSWIACLMHLATRRYVLLVYSLEFRRRTPSGNYVWCAVTSLRQYLSQPEVCQKIGNLPQLETCSNRRVPSTNIRTSNLQRRNERSMTGFHPNLHLVYAVLPANLLRS